MARSAVCVVDTITSYDHPDDAYRRHFDVAVAADATAHIHADLAEAALKMMEVNMRAEIAGADEVSLP